ncbi:hypothetical protein FB567DRAFT_523499 [Paraphoma chrysanthemicola]|uniref:NmrA-like domain-containing protein n=1 Tax=Paraphoma chrysanthemicola TaxID=798071 RepID=A0A8K0R6S2_9PLEO|nr:hypothetical protein FB567DRAFT_523499 [Paraphoma chrysanthemicola]
MSNKTALIMRATGAQGRGTITRLVQSGWNVHALVTDASSERALALKTLGPNVLLYQGTWRDPSTIAAAAVGCSVLLLNQLPSFTDDAEVQEARTVLRIAQEAGVQHVVFPTTVPLNNPNVREDLKDSAAAPAILNKGDVEELVKASGMTWTLLRPGYFMTNLLPPLVSWMFPGVNNGKLVNSYGPDCLMDLIDPDDIGAFVAAAFEDPTKFSGQTITLVAENVRFDDVVKQLAQTSGQPFEAVYRTPEESEELKNNPLIAGHLLCIGLDRFIDLDESRRWGIPLTSFAQFLEKHKHELPIIGKVDSTIVPYTDRSISGKE